MANASMINGLRPVRNAFSGFHVGSMVKCVLLATEANNLAVGDPVTLEGNSNPAQMSGYSFNQVEGAYASVRKAASGDPIYGVIGGFEPRAVVGYEQLSYRAGTGQQQ